VAGHGGDAAERRLAEALGAQASLAAAPGSTRASLPGSTGATPQPASTGSAGLLPPGAPDPRTGVPGGPTRRRREAAPSGPSAAPGRSGGPDSATRLRRALLIALLAGVLLGCALALLSVLVPGLLPALG
jgi:hypothetical protein